MDGTEIRQARARAGLTQQQLAAKVGVTLRTIGNWERGESVPRNKEHLLREILLEHLGHASPALTSASDAQLLAEIARRFERGHQAAEDGGQRGDTASMEAWPVKGRRGGIAVAHDGAEQRDQQAAPHHPDGS